MTRHNHAFFEFAGGDSGRHYARLRTVLDLARRIAGSPPKSTDRALNETARLISVYDAASPIARRRFDALAAEAAVWAAAAMDALASATDAENQPKAAALRLADELDRALAEMRKLIGG